MGKKNLQVDIQSGEEKSTATIVTTSSARSSMDSTPDRIDVHCTPNGTIADKIVETLSIWTSDVVEGVFFGPYDEPRAVKQTASAG